MYIYDNIIISWRRKSITFNFVHRRLLPLPAAARFVDQVFAQQTCDVLQLRNNNTIRPYMYSERVCIICFSVWYNIMTRTMAVRCGGVHSHPTWC